jgi:two-component system phosphate regulon response regulator OmpR
MMALIGKRVPDLITLDLKLGGEDGFALARTVRAQANVPIIMISGKGGHGRPRRRARTRRR